MSTEFIQTDGLSKSYGSFAALVDCSLSIGRGEVFGLLGPNGAGKTTLLRLIMGLIRPTSGRATVDGLDCQRDLVAVHHRISYLPGDARLYRSWRGRTVLRFFSQLRPEGDLRRAQAIAERLGLDLGRPVAFMSTGMRQKLALSVALSYDVPLYILDEPTSNLDPTVRGEIVSLVREKRNQGRTVLFSSHVLSEVEQACDRVLILRAGRIVHHQPVHDLRRQYRIRAQLSGVLPPAPAGLDREIVIRPEREGWVTMDTESDLPPLLGWLARCPLADLQIEPIGLQAIYDKYHASGRAE